MRSYNYLLFFVAHDLHRSRRFPSHFTCLSDNMFGLIAGSDIQRIPSAGTPLTHDACKRLLKCSFHNLGQCRLYLLPMVISTREYETIYNYTKSRTPKTTVSPRYPKWGPTGLVGWGPIVTQSVPLGLNIPETKNKLEPTPYPVNSPETKAQFSPRFSYDILSGTQLGLLGPISAHSIPSKQPRSPCSV